MWPFVILSGQYCHQDNSLMLNGGGESILEKALQEILLKVNKEERSGGKKENCTSQTVSWKDWAPATDPLGSDCNFCQRL